MELSAIQHLYAFEDGDTILPGMGLVIDSGYGLQQFWNPDLNKVTNTDFTQHPATLFPQAYSSKLAQIIVPETSGQQWYYNVIGSEGAILENGAVRSKFASLFELTTVTQNGQTFPALKIKGNLATALDHTDKYIYYESSYQGKQFTCQQLIPIQASVGEAYDILFSTTGKDGIGDNVLTSDDDWVQFTALLQCAGATVSGAQTCRFYRMQNGSWVQVTHTTGLIEVSNNVIKIFEAAVYGVDIFKAEITYNGQTYSRTFEVSDTHDIYYIINGSSCPSGAVKVGETVTYNPKVYNRQSGVEDPGWTFNYTLTNQKTGSVITSITAANLTYENIRQYGPIAVRIEANKPS